MLACLFAALAFPVAEVLADIPYVVHASDRQMLDLYIPDKKPYKTLVFAYGGGWHSGSRKNMGPVGKWFQSLGYGCAMIGYRLSPPDPWPAQIDDAADAAAWTLKHIAEYGGDPKQVWLAGHSSGAHLTILLATDPSWLSKRGLKPTDFRGFIGISTPLDLVPHGNGQFADILMAGQGADVFKRDLAVMKKASPIEFASQGKLPPILLLAADGDMPGLAPDAQRFTQIANRNGSSVRAEIIKGRTHMTILFDLLQRGDPALDAVQAFMNGS